MGLLVAISGAFAWVLWPFSGAVFWAVVAAILFEPLFQTVLRQVPRRTLASLLTLAVVLVIVILPLAMVTLAMTQEAQWLVNQVQAGQIDLTRFFGRVMAVLPDWARHLLERLGLGDLRAVQARIGAALAAGSQLVAARALTLGQDTVDWVVSFFLMLYLLFFFLRDGRALSDRIALAVPLAGRHKDNLLGQLAIVVRATVRGNVVIAAVQGALGGLAFAVLGIHGAVLWAALMAFLSLLPAIGAALVWIPVAAYFFAAGAWVKAIGLVAYGVVVMGLVDNVLRPILVGKDTRMPDYLVLMSTLGGIAVFGLNGFVIGPVIAALFMATWGLFADARQADAIERS